MKVLTRKLPRAFPSPCRISLVSVLVFLSDLKFQVIRNGRISPARMKSNSFSWMINQLCPFPHLLCKHHQIDTSEMQTSLILSDLSPDDNGRVIVCSAENMVGQNEATLQLDIHCKASSFPADCTC